MEVPLAAARSPSGRRWNPSDNASSCAVDTAPCGLLRVRVWRFPRPKVRSAGGCLARLRHESQPTLCHTQGLARDSAPSNPKRPALRWSSRAGASPPFPPWRRIPMGKRRTVMVAVRVSPTEFADWRAKAAAAGVPLSALIRRAMARTRTWTAPAAEVERERTRQVSRIGNNLNQIARWANTHKGAAEAVEVIVHLVPIERALRALAPVGDPDPDAH